MGPIRNKMGPKRSKIQPFWSVVFHESTFSFSMSKLRSIGAELPKMHVCVNSNWDN